jgi:membrane protease YdiL (CAAX protease family)
MLYLAMFNWPWLLASVLIGLAMGWIAVVHRGQGFSNATMRKVGVFVVALIVSSALHLAPGRAGYWLDLGLVMFAVYIAGCAVGSWLRNLVVSRDMSAS